MIGSCLIVELLGTLVSKEVLEKQPTIYTLSRYGFAFICLFLVEVLSSATLFRHLKYVQFNIKYHCMY